MKKNHPSQNPINPAINLEELYAKVNKTRRVQQPAHSGESSRTDANVEQSHDRLSEEVIYADVNVGDPRGRNPAAEVVYADINIGDPRGRNPATETVYADINVGDPRGRNPATETVYADINVGDPRGRNPATETVYADINVEGRGGMQPKKEMAHASAGIESTKPPLTQDYIAAQLLKNPAVQSSTVKVQEWCGLVYGNEHVFNKQLLQILQDPGKGENILWGIAQNPESPGSLAGRKTLGIKNRERLQAEEGFPSFCDALEKHVAIVKQAHKSITQEHERRQGHERGESQEKHLERRAHHHTKEKQQDVGDQSVQQQKQAPKKGMAMAM
ncbi:BID domain-containing T4SS effector [Bartonella sp. B39]